MSSLFSAHSMTPHALRRGPRAAWFRDALLILCLVAALLWPAARGHALDASKVFEAVSPSTVFIEDLDGFGSGIFLNDKGLILTNYHVVAAGISLKVRARVKFGARVVLTELTDVKVTKIHKDYDLALLEVKPPQNGTFIPARLVPQAPALSTGIRCFAIGNPGGPSGKALELSITEGLVSAAFRQVDGLEYTQVSAQINPGNSGGPVCDDQGRVFGIATWKMTETEGIGFAIPTQRLKMTDFVDVKAKKPDLDLARKAEIYANRYLHAAMSTQGRERAALLLLSLEGYRICMLAAPNDPAPFAYICDVYQQLGEMELAKKYAAAALERDPKNPSASHMLGSMLMHESNNDPAVEAKSMAMWFTGLESTQDQVSRSFCADDIAVSMINQQRWAACAYMIQWADVLEIATNPNVYSGTMGEFLQKWETILPQMTDMDNRIGKRLRMWKLLQEKMPAAELALVRSKGDHFSKADFDALLAGRPVTEIVKPTVIATASTPVAVPGSPVAPVSLAKPGVTPEQMARMTKDTAAKFGPTQVPVPLEGLECPLPDVAGRPVLAYNGWQLVIPFPDLMKLGIFNLATGALEGFIDCAEREPLLAAGGQLLTVYLPGSQTLEIYDLATQKKIISKVAPAGSDPIRFVGMGLLDPTRIFVLQYVNTSGREIFRPSILKLPNLEVTELLPEIKNGNNPLWNMMAWKQVSIEGGMDETGVVAVIVQSNGGSAIYRIREGNRIDFKNRDLPPGTPAVTQGGNFVTTNDAILDAATFEDPVGKSGTSRDWRPELMTPVAGYAAYAGYGSAVQSGSVFQVFALPAMSSLLTLPLDPVKTTLPPARKDGKQNWSLLASAYCDRIACVLGQEKKVILLPLGLKSGAAGSGFAEAGKHFERKLDIAAGSTVTLQSGPAGLKYDAARTSLVWDVPADAKGGQMIKVILRVKDASAKESYLVEKISVP